jgi:hypothetical protein
MRCLVYWRSGLDAFSGSKEESDELPLQIFLFGVERTPVHHATPAVSQTSKRFAAPGAGFLIFFDIGLPEAMARHWRCSCVL